VLEVIAEGAKGLDVGHGQSCQWSVVSGQWRAGKMFHVKHFGQSPLCAGLPTPHKYTAAGRRSGDLRSEMHGTVGKPATTMSMFHVKHSGRPALAEPVAHVLSRSMGGLSKGR
jgi:hypothetical protein